MFRSKDVPDQMKLFGELKRRNVFRVAAAYVVLGWVVIQVTDTVSPALHLPDWTLTFITWIGIVVCVFGVAGYFVLKTPWAQQFVED